MSSFRLGELAERLGCELFGEASTIISGVATIDKAQPGELTFLSNPKYARRIEQTRASAVLSSKRLEGTGAAILISSNPYFHFAQALSFYYQPPHPIAGIHPTACIHPTAVIGANASIGAYVVIGADTVLGDDATLHPHAVIYEGCRIGDNFTAHSHVSVREYTKIGNRVTLHNGVVIGGDGFGFAKRDDGTHYKIVQSGVTVIEDDVEVQTLSSIDRASLGETRIKRGTKIDSLVQIGHACVVGEDNILCGQSGLAGSTVLENNVIMAGQAGSSGHLTVGRDAVVWAQSGLVGDVKEGSVVAGAPAFDSREWLRASAAFPDLPELLKTVRALQRRVAELETGSTAK